MRPRLLAALLWCFLAWTPLSWAVTSHRVQSAICLSGGGQDSYTCGYASNVTAGSLLVVWCAVLQQDTFSTADAAFSDTRSNTYLMTVNRGVDDPTSNIGRVFMAYVQNAIAGATTITCDPPPPLSGLFISMVVVEYSGMLSSGVFDQAAVNSSGDTPGTAVTSGTTGTTTQASEVISAGMTYRNNLTPPENTITEGGGYDLVQEGQDASTYQPISVTDTEVSGTGTQSASWTLGGSHRWAAGIATWKTTTGGGRRRLRNIYP